MDNLTADEFFERGVGRDVGSADGILVQDRGFGWAILRLCGRGGRSRGGALITVPETMRKLNRGPDR